MVNVWVSKGHNKADGKAAVPLLKNNNVLVKIHLCKIKIVYTCHPQTGFVVQKKRYDPNK